MPVVQQRHDMTATAQTSDAWRAPHKTLMANTMTAAQAVAKAKPETVAQGDATKDAIANKIAENTQIGQDKTNEEVKSEVVTLSPQVTALARKEQAFRKQEQAFKAKEQEFKAAQEAFEKTQTEYSTLAKSKERLAADDYSVLDELGVSYEKWTNYLLAKGETAKPEYQAINEVKEELKSIKAKEEERIKKEEERVNKQYEATVNQYRKEIKAAVESNPAYESVKALGAEEHVLQHILDTFNEDGETLSVEEAAKEIEDALVEDSWATASKLKKVQEKLVPKVETKKVLPPPTSKQPVKTLTQDLPPAGTKTYPQFQHLSPKERIAQAIAKAQR